MALVIELVSIILVSVFVTTLLYHLASFRKLSATKPKMSWFPKYTHIYSIPIEDVLGRIEELGFVARKEKTDEFDRGKIYGDFSAKMMKLRIQLDKDGNTIKVFAPYFGVLFDNGELWEIANKITVQNKP